MKIDPETEISKIIDEIRKIAQKSVVPDEKAR